MKFFLNQVFAAQNPLMNEEDDDFGGGAEGFAMSASSSADVDLETLAREQDFEGDEDEEGYAEVVDGPGETRKETSGEDDERPADGEQDDKEGGEEGADPDGAEKGDDDPEHVEVDPKKPDSALTPEERSIRYHQGRADKANAQVRQLEAQLETLESLKQLQDALDADPVKAQQLFAALMNSEFSGAATQDAGPELPAKPEMPAGEEYDAYEAATDPSSASYKYQQQIREWERECDRLTVRHQIKSEMSADARAKDLKLQRVEARAQLDEALVDAGFRTKEERDGFYAWAKSPESNSKAAWILAYKAHTGLLAKESSDRSRDRGVADQARRASSAPASPARAKETRVKEQTDDDAFASALSSGGEERISGLLDFS